MKTFTLRPFSSGGRDFNFEIQPFLGDVESAIASAIFMTFGITATLVKKRVVNDVLVYEFTLGTGKLVYVWEI